MNKAKIHQLKTWPTHFQDLIERKKTFEIRKNDRDFQVGNLLELLEWQPIFKGSMESPFEIVGGSFTGRNLTVEVTHILSAPEFGVDENVVILSIKFQDTLKFKEPTTNEKPFNIYEIRIGENKSWYCARTVLEALLTSRKIEDIDLWDFGPSDDVVIVPQSEWTELKIIDPEGRMPDRTFWDYMQEVTGPDIIATTVY